MEFVCSHCGYRSPSRDFFREERVWYAPVRRTFCHGCQSYKASALQRQSLIGGPAFLLIGLILHELGAAGVIRSGLGGVFLFFGTMVIALPTVILVHELGHLAAGRLVGVRLVHMVLGSGPRLFFFRMGRLHVTVRAFALGGGVVGYQTGEPRKWREAVFILGGVLGNAAVVVLLVVAFGAFLDDRKSGTSPFMPILFGLMATHGITIIMNLRPNRVTGPGRQPPNDGRMLFSLPRDKTFRRRMLDARLALEIAPLIDARDHAAVCARLEPELGRTRTQPMIFFHYIFARAKLTSPHEAIAFYLTSDIDLDAVERAQAGALAFVHAMLAWIGIVSRDKDLIEFADTMSLKAIALRPGPTEIEGTRGMAQILAGDAADGAPRALLAMRSSENETLRVEIPRALAVAERAHGNAAMGDELLRLATHLEARAEARWLARHRLSPAR